MEEILIFVLLALIAEIIGTVSGFGSSILFVPIATLFFDFHIVLGITAVFHVFSNLSKIALFRKGVNKNIVIKLGIPAVIFVIIGAFLTRFLEVRTMELLLSVLLIILSLFLAFNHKFQLAQSNRNLYAGGVVSGFLAGLIGTGGAIRGLTMVAFNLEKSVFVATSALIDLGVDLSRAVVYTAGGYFQKEHIKLIPFLVFISIVGSYIGKLILQRTKQEVFRYIALVVIIGTSVVQLVKFMV